MPGRWKQMAELEQPCWPEDEVVTWASFCDLVLQSAKSCFSTSTSFNAIANSASLSVSWLLWRCRADARVWTLSFSPKNCHSRALLALLLVYSKWQTYQSDQHVHIVESLTAWQTTVYWQFSSMRLAKWALPVYKCKCAVAFTMTTHLHIMGCACV